MIKQIEIINSDLGIQRFDFYYKCNFCSVLSNKTKDGFCRFCYKYLNYSKENDVVLFTVKNIFIQMAQKKIELNISHYDFLEIEKTLLKITDENFSFTYNANNLTWYVDFGFDQYNESLLQIVQTCSDLIKNIFKKMYFNAELQDFSVNIVKEKIEYFEKNRCFKEKETILMPEVQTLYKVDALSQRMINSLDRINITRNFYENLNFYAFNE